MAKKPITAEDLLAEASSGGGQSASPTADDLLAEVSGGSKAATNFGPLRGGFVPAPKAEQVPRLPTSTPEDRAVPDRDMLRMQARRYGSFDERTPEEDDRAMAEVWNQFNAYGLGLPNRIQRALSPEGTAAREATEAAHPNEAAAGKVMGGAASALFGPARALGAAVTAGVGAIPGLASSALGRVAASGLTGAVSGGAQSGLTDESVDSAKRGALTGGLLGAAAQGLGEGARWIGKFAGEDPAAGAYTAARESGRLADIQQEAKTGALPKGTRGLRVAAERARDEALAAEERVSRAAGEKVRAGQAAVANEPADMQALTEKMQELSAKNRAPIRGDVLDQGLEDEQADLLGKLGSVPARGDVAAYKRTFDERANWLAPDPTDAQRHARDLYKALAAGSSTKADEEFAAFSRQKERWNDLLTGGEEGARPISVGNTDRAQVPIRELYRAPDLTRAADKVGRYHDQNIPGARAASDLEELAADPNFSKAFRDLGERKAYLNTRYSFLPNKPTDSKHATAYPVRLIKDNLRSFGIRNLPEIKALGAGAEDFADYGEAGPSRAFVSPMILRLSRALRGQKGDEQ